MPAPVLPICDGDVAVLFKDTLRFCEAAMTCAARRGSDQRKDKHRTHYREQDTQ